MWKRMSAQDHHKANQKRLAVLKRELKLTVRVPEERVGPLHSRREEYAGRNLKGLEDERKLSR
jgi:hypothetical protein